MKKRAAYVVGALIIANEIRGVIVVATIGWPVLRSML